MLKKTWWLTVATAALAVLIFQTFVGGYIEARLSTNPTLQRWGLVTPRAPIVITNRETVRVSDGNDIIDGFNKVKSKVGTIAIQEQSTLTPTGTALSWTTDGWFVSVLPAVQAPGKTYVVITYNGDIMPITSVVTNTRSNMVFLKTDAKNLAVAGVASSGDMELGQKVVLANGAGRATEVNFGQTVLQAKEQVRFGATASADILARSPSVDASEALLFGTVLATTNGDVLGVWNGTQVVPVSHIKAMANKIAAQVNTTPKFGFSYRFVEPVEVKLFNSVAGVKVTQIDDKKAVAASVGLQVGDVITAVDGNKITTNTSFDAAVEQLTKGAVSVWQINRAGQELTLQVKL